MKIPLKSKNLREKFKDQIKKKKQEINSFSQQKRIGKKQFRLLLTPGNKIKWKKYCLNISVQFKKNINFFKVTKKYQKKKSFIFSIKFLCKIKYKEANFLKDKHLIVSFLK